MSIVFFLGYFVIALPGTLLAVDGCVIVILIIRTFVEVSIFEVAIFVLISSGSIGHNFNAFHLVVISRVTCLQRDFHWSLNL